MLEILLLLGDRRLWLLKQGEQGASATGSLESGRRQRVFTLNSVVRQWRHRSILSPHREKEERGPAGIAVGGGRFH